MSFIRSGQNGAGPNGSIAIHFDDNGTPTVGNLVIVGIGSENVSISSIQDNASGGTNTYSEAFSYQNTNSSGWVRIYYSFLARTLADLTVTVTFSSSNFANAATFEYS